MTKEDYYEAYRLQNELKKTHRLFSHEIEDGTIEVYIPANNMFINRENIKQLEHILRRISSTTYLTGNQETNQIIKLDGKNRKLNLKSIGFNNLKLCLEHFIIEIN